MTKKNDNKQEIEGTKTLGYLTDHFRRAIQSVNLLKIGGRVTAISGSLLKSDIPNVSIGEVCAISTASRHHVKAEVIGFVNSEAILTPLGDLYGASLNSSVFATGSAQTIPVGNELLGRVIDGLCNPIDNLGEIRCPDTQPLYNSSPEPMKRIPIHKPISFSVKAVDSLLTIGEGQRVGVFAAAGVGKSTLLSAFIKGAQADIIVLALIGERGREVRSFIENDLGKEGMQKTVVVCSTSDKSSMERLRSGYVATAIAEYFRDQGLKVVLLMDSVTRFARAQRTIGLAAGEPPTRRGFPPSVFDTLPKLMERAGNNDIGSITAIYTVLSEGDDMTEPVSDEVRSILDGHIVLSRELAATNHYPAIDVLNSVSRVMNEIVDDEHKQLASKIRTIISKYKDAELLIQVGEYKKGTDEATDYAIDRISAVNDLLLQGKELVSFEDTLNMMRSIVV